MVIEHHIDVVGHENLERGSQRSFGQRMGVETNEERTVDAVLTAIVENRLADSEDMRLVERVRESRSAMTGGTESHHLGGDRRVRFAGKLGGHQSRYVDQGRRRNDLARERTYTTWHFCFP